VPVEQYQLGNGLTVLLSEDHRLPVVATEVLYLVGSGHEKPGRTGFAHLFEHLMFQGSQHHDAEFFAPFEPIGALVNGTTSADRTNYYERVPSNFLELSLWMESDRMRSLLPVLSQQKLDNQRDVVKNERRQRYEVEPYGLAFYHLSEALYPESHPYHHDTIGSHEDLTAASLTDVQDFFRRYYTPSNAVLTIAGDFNPTATKSLVERYFGDIPAGERAAAPSAPMPQLPGVVHWVKKDDVELPRIYMAWHSPALYAPGDAELDLWSSVLTDGKTSRLFQPLVYEQKVAKEVAAFQASEKLSSSFVIMATAAPGVSLDQLESALGAALKKALAAPPSERELERAQNAFKKGFYSRIEAVDSRASLLANYYLHTGRADYLGEDLGRYVKATSASVHEAARRYMDPQRYVRLDFVPGERSAPVEKLPLVAPTAAAPAPSPTLPKAAPATAAPATAAPAASKTEGAAK
jgi:predicted Zn-dependent peptidase